MSAATSPLIRANFEFLRLAEVHESELNPRKTFNQSGLEELAQSIRESGVWTPITVRPIGKRFYVSPGSLRDSQVRYVAVKNIVGKENLLKTFSGGTASENEANALEEAARENNKESGYEIAAGHRRYRAAKMAGLTQIPAIVRAMTDQQFAELVTFENLGREDVHPLEEAAGFEALIRDYAYTAAAIAEKIGCHESYVHKRLRLARLIEPARKAFAGGDISLNHAVLIARLEPAQQIEAFSLCFEERWDHKSRKDLKEAVPAKSLDLRIREKIFLALSSAPWKKDDAQLLPKAGACTTCPKRTGANAQLFDDMQKGDNCLDGDCFDRKRQAFIRITTAAYAQKNGKEMVRVATSYCDPSALKKLEAMQAHSFTEVKGKDRCAHVERAMVVYGDKLGHQIDICRTAKCAKHGNSIGGQYGRYQRSAAEIAAEQKRKIDAKIDVGYREALWYSCWAKMQEDGELDAGAVQVIAHYLIERIGHDGRGPLVKALDLKPETKVKSQGYEDTNSKLLRAYFGKLESLDKQLMFLLALATAPALGSMYGAAIKTLETVAIDCGVDANALKRVIAAPILAAAKKRAESEKKKAAEAKKAAPAKAKAPKASTKEPDFEEVDEDEDEDEDEPDFEDDASESGEEDLT
jgi:ParB/RepB/Spo0J family partition protein